MKTTGHWKLKLLQLFFFLYLGLFGIEEIQAQDNIELSPALIGSFKARHIGPATMSGRISALDAVDSRPVLLYVGAAGGGVWKSASGGVKFKPVFEKYPQSIGAITIDRDHPDTVWVGTGETWTRNST